MAQTPAAGGRTRLYLITPPCLVRDPASKTFADELDLALGADDVACLQLRLKDADDDAFRAAAGSLMPICHAHDVAFIVNDRPEMAAEVGADGVHIGADDGGYTNARRLVGADAVVGVSCYDSRDLGLESAEAGADYVAFGAFFATGTKRPRTRVKPDILRWWQEMVTVPCVAIGGIAVDNCGELVAAGADFLAVISGVWDHRDGPAAAVVAYNRRIDEAMERR